jgi:hypothetical protein
MISDTDLPHQPDTLPHPPLMKKTNILALIAIITLFSIELPLTIFLITALFSPLAIVYPLYFPIFLALAIINIFVFKKHLQNTTKLVRLISKSIALIFIASYSYLTVLFVIPFMIGLPRMIPVFLSKDKAIKQVVNCNVSFLKRDSHENGIVIKIGFEKGYDTSQHFVANSDLDAIFEAARAVKDRCGYNFEAFVPGIEGFENRYDHIYTTIDRATEFLNNCKVDEVIFIHLSEKVDWEIYGLRTGRFKETPWNLEVRKDLEAKMLPILCEAKKKCHNWRIPCE